MRRGGRPGAPRRPSGARAAALLAALLAGGCGSFPIDLVVPDAALRELRRTHDSEGPSRAAVEREMRARLGYEGGPRPLLDAGFYRLDVDPHGPFPTRAVERVGSRWSAGLAPGDVVLAKNWRPQSLACTLALRDFCYYDHAGLLERRGGRWYVLESWPRVHLLGGAPDFAARFRGEVGRARLGCFLRRYSEVVVVHLPDAGRDRRMVAAAQRLAREHVPFDPYDVPGDRALSCSELIEELLHQAGYPDVIARVPPSDCPSIQRVRLALGFRGDEFVVPDSFAELPGARSVAWFARHATRSEALAVHEAFRWLHEECGPGSFAGDHLAIDPLRLLAYRRSTERFLAWTKGYFAARPCEDPAAIGRVVACIAPIFFPAAEVP